jgi:hypothetical protein
MGVLTVIQVTHTDLNIEVGRRVHSTLIFKSPIGIHKFRLAQNWDSTTKIRKIPATEIGV